MAGSVILTSPLKTMVPIIKIVGNFCNLRCQYCFYREQRQSSPQVMNDELLEKFISQYMSLFSGKLFFIWHGGEPLLAGLSFFQKIIYLQKKYLKKGQIVKNAVQTNATLINDNWAKFFQLNGFQVGVSLDGDEESHNRFRKNANRKGSFKIAVNGIKILRQYGIEPGIIQTLTRANLSKAAINFDFFTNDLGLKSFGVNYFFSPNKEEKFVKNQSISCKELTSFFKIYIDKWLNLNNDKIRIREIDNFIAGAIGKQSPSCAFNGSCTGYFCLEYDGKVYPCDRLPYKDEFLFGDLSNQSLLEILNSSKRLIYAQNVNSSHLDCLKCQWQKACHNGCPADRKGGVKGKYYFCETRKEFFSCFDKKILNSNNRKEVSVL
ncbi:MAG: radical SAM protein [Patescibacteria group bacterium]